MRQLETMKRLCIGGVSTLAGYAGWFLADACGFGFMGAFFVSGLGSIVGVYLGWKLAQRFE